MTPDELVTRPQSIKPMHQLLTFLQVYHNKLASIIVTCYDEIADVVNCLTLCLLSEWFTQRVVFDITLIFLF
jgi:hypothetical protein